VKLMNICSFMLDKLGYEGGALTAS
jgi:hypothetical protein